MMQSQGKIITIVLKQVATLQCFYATGYLIVFRKRFHLEMQIQIYSGSNGESRIYLVQILTKIGKVMKNFFLRTSYSDIIEMV